MSQNTPLEKFTQFLQDCSRNELCTNYLGTPSYETIKKCIEDDECAKLTRRFYQSYNLELFERCVGDEKCDHADNMIIFMSSINKE